MVWEDASFVSFPRNTPAPANYYSWGPSSPLVRGAVMCLALGARTSTSSTNALITRWFLP